MFYALCVCVGGGGWGSVYGVCVVIIILIIIIIITIINYLFTHSLFVDFGFTNVGANQFR